MVGAAWLILPFVGGVAVGLAVAWMLRAERPPDEQLSWRER